MRIRSSLVALLMLCATARADGITAGVPAGMPVPASAPPPGIGDTNVKGADTPTYALADHTHASSVQKAMLTTDASGQVVWTFASPYPLPPTVQITVETVSGQPYIALITDRTTSSVTIKVLRAQTLPATLTLLSNLVSFNVFGGAVGAGVLVHVWAAKP